MQYAYSNNGLSFRAVANDYVAAQGEVMFEDIATPTELAAAFSGYTAASTAAIIPVTANTAITAGLTVTSTSTPSLNGTYACDGMATADINAEITSLMLNSTFADGGTTVSWPDASGTLHTFSIAQFKTLATAIAAFVSGVVKYARGINQNLPSNSVTIA